MVVGLISVVFGLDRLDVGAEGRAPFVWFWVSSVVDPRSMPPLSPASSIQENLLDLILGVDTASLWDTADVGCGCGVFGDGLFRSGI